MAVRSGGRGVYEVNELVQLRHLDCTYLLLSCLNLIKTIGYGPLAFHHLIFL